MKNKGYYSWIHSLKNAAVQSHIKGREMINEEKAKKITSPETRASLGQALERKTHTPPKTGSHGNFPIEDEQGRPAMDLSLQKAGNAMAGVMRALSAAGHPSYKAASETSISAAGGDAAEFARLRAMKAAEAAADNAKESGPVDAEPEGDAQDVEDDALDGTMADPPMSPMSPEEAKAAEDEWEAREEARLNAGPTGRTGELYYESAFINSKIASMLNEEEEEIRKESDQKPRGKGKRPGTQEKPSGSKKFVGRGGVNFGALLDVYNNPGKYPANISQAVNASFKDIFERGLGLPKN